MGRLCALCVAAFAQAPDVVIYDAKVLAGLPENRLRKRWRRRGPGSIGARQITAYNRILLQQAQYLRGDSSVIPTTLSPRFSGARGVIEALD